jgi:hypothetical protein
MRRGRICLVSPHEGAGPGKQPGAPVMPGQSGEHGLAQGGKAVGEGRFPGTVWARQQHDQPRRLGDALQRSPGSEKRRH